MMVGLGGAVTVGKVISLNSRPNNAFFKEVLPQRACPMMVIFCPETVNVVDDAVSRGALLMVEIKAPEGIGGACSTST